MSDSSTGVVCDSCLFMAEEMTTVFAPDLDPVWVCINQGDDHDDHDCEAEDYPDDTVCQCKCRA